MSSTWQNKYNELRDYISKNTSIHIDRFVMIIPDDVRPEFYRLFDGIRTEYIRENFPGLLEEATLLGAKYAEARDVVAARLNLKSIETSPTLKWFLDDPVKGLIHGLSDPLFDLIRGTATLPDFEETAAGIVGKKSAEYFHNGYRHWVTLSLLRLLLPDEAYIVPLPDQFEEPELNDAETIPGVNIHEVPRIEKAETVQLDFSQYTPFIGPNVVVHSGLLNAFAGMRDGYNNIFRRARALSKKVEWHKMEGIRQRYGTNLLWPDLGIYLQGMKERVKILAEYFHAARPDVIADVIAAHGWREEDALKLAKRHNDILKPRGGSFIISREPPAAAPPETSPGFGAEAGASGEQNQQVTGADTTQAGEHYPDVTVLVVGYDEGKLQPVIDALKSLEVTPADEEDELEEIYG